MNYPAEITDRKQGKEGERERERSEAYRRLPGIPKLKLKF